MNFNRKDNNRGMNIEKAIGKAERIPLCTLSNKAFRELDQSQRNLIIIFEQIAKMKGVSTMRNLAQETGIGAPAIQSYLKGEVKDPTSISRRTFDKIAASRGISAKELWLFLRGEEDFQFERSSEFLYLCRNATIEDAIEGLQILVNRVIDEVKGKSALTEVEEAVGEEEEEEAVTFPGNIRIVKLLDEREKEWGDGFGKIF